MNKYLLVLGSNWQLSLAEIDNVLRFSHIKGRITDYSANIAIVEFETLQEDEHYVNQLEELQFLLGGCQKIAKIYDFIPLNTIEAAFPSHLEKFKEADSTRKRILKIIENKLIGKNSIFPKVYESMFFAVSIYPELFDDDYYKKVLVKHFLPFLNKEIMEILKEKGSVKTLYYKYPEKNIKSGYLNPIFPHHLIKYELFSPNRAEILFGFTEEGVYLARTFTADDPNFKKKIDEKRPCTDFKSAISPKLALVMLNYLNLFDKREEMKIIDPFVGNGTILLFAILQDFNVFGTDNDKKRIDNTIRNINWLHEEIEQPLFSMINQHIKEVDITELSQHFTPNFFDGICTEPPLGPFFMKEKPYYREAREIIDSELEPIYRSLFKEANTVLKPRRRICLIAPLISTLDSKDVQVNIEGLATQNHFKLIKLIDTDRIINKSNNKLQIGKQHQRSLVDAKKGQVVKRKIYVFEKLGEKN